jgi:hypothetical protein
VLLQRHSFALECLFRAEKPLTDLKLKAVRERVRASFSRLRLITQTSDDLQNAGEMRAAVAEGCEMFHTSAAASLVCNGSITLPVPIPAFRILLPPSQQRTAGVHHRACRSCTP